MTDIQSLIRPNIASLSPYSSARDEFKGEANIYLDANENPFGVYNRYPDPLQIQLKQQLAQVKNVPFESVFIGNGSDEIIDLLFRIFCVPGRDKALTFSPTYGMYAVSACINDVELVEIPLNQKFQIPRDSIQKIKSIDDLKLIFICSPNNPTGNSLSIDTIQEILEVSNSIVAIDEAYIDFSTQDSLINLIGSYPNLIILQTLSKAWGLAALRIGLAFANPQLIQLLTAVKPPYNVNALSQLEAIKAVGNYELKVIQVQAILTEREKLKVALEQLQIVEGIFPSDTNFLLVKVFNADDVYEKLVERKIIIRNRSQIIQDCIRITVGTPEENIELINTLKSLS